MRNRKGCGGNDLQKRKVLSLEWKSEWVTEYRIIVSMTVGRQRPYIGLPYKQSAYRWRSCINRLCIQCQDSTQSIVLPCYNHLSSARAGAYRSKRKYVRILTPVCITIDSLETTYIIHVRLACLRAYIYRPSLSEGTARLVYNIGWQWRIFVPLPMPAMSGGVLAWLSVWSEVQTGIWPSWCHCHSLSLASVKSRLVLPLWYRPTWVVLEKGPLNVCVCVCVCVYLCQLVFRRHLVGKTLRNVSYSAVTEIRLVAISIMRVFS